MTPRRALLGLTFLVLVLFEEVVFRGRVFYERDIHLVWYPYLEAVRHSLASGSWPLWNQFSSFGEPLWANPAIQILYPTTWIALLWNPAPAYILFVLSHVILSAFGLFLFAQRLGISKTGSFLSASLWILSGPYLSFLNLWHHFAGISWFPWILLATDHALRSPSPRRTLLWGAALAGQILAGSADACAMAALLSTAYALRFLDTDNPRGALTLLLHGASAWLLAIGLTTAQWLPTLELASRSARWNLTSVVRDYWSVHPLMLLQALFPFRWGELPLRADVQAAVFGSRLPFLVSLYLGSASLVLAGASFAKPRPVTVALAGIAALATAVALGPWTPLHGILVGLLPPLRSLRYPVKVMAVTAFSLALLAGLGFDVASDPTVARTRRFFALALPSLGLLLLGGGVAWQLRSHPEHAFSSLLAPSDPDTLLRALRGPILHVEVAAAVAGAALLLGLLSLARPAAARPALAGIACLAVLDLFVAHETLNRTAGSSFFRFLPSVVGAMGDRHFQRIHVRPYFLRFQDGSWRRDANLTLAPSATEGNDLDLVQSLALDEILYPASAARWDIETSYDGDILGLYPGPLGALVSRLSDVEGTPAYVRLLQLGGVSQVVGFGPGPEDLPIRRVLQSQYSEPLRLYDVPGALPRCFAVSGSRVEDGPSALALATDPSFDPRVEAILPGGSPRPPVSGFSGTCTIATLLPDRVVLEASLSHPGILVLLDTYDPGWRVSVDGEPAPLLRANVAFRGIDLREGSHRVELLYRPASVLLGASLSLATLLLGTVVAFRVP